MAEEKKQTKERPALTRKKAQVKEFEADLAGAKNIVVIDLRKLPDKLLQNIRKQLREKGTNIKVAKSAVITRALESSGKPKELIDLFEDPAALVITETTPYELNSFFKKNTMEVAAKPGQIAPEDIIVPAGETNLAPGPALSELKAAGLNAQIRGPKISIVKDSTVVKAGEEITLEKAKALQTLGFKPFTVNVNILLAYDGEYIYAPELLDISAESLAPEFVTSLQGAFNLSVNAAIPTEQNITLLLTEAFTQGRNVGVNGSIYSPQAIEQLLTQSLRAGLALTDLAPAAKEEASKEEPKEVETPKEESKEEKSSEASAEEPKEEPKPEKKEEAPKEEPKEEKPVEKPKEEPKPKKKAEEPKVEKSEEKPKEEKPKVEPKDKKEE